MAVTNYYTVGGEIIGERTAGSSRVDYLTDALGSVTATLNQSAQVVNTYRYKPYGSLLAKTGTGADPAFGWNGTHGYRKTAKKFSDFYVRARHYDSVGGRWSTVDPLWPNEPMFTYSQSSPALYVDSSGRNVGVIVGIGAGLIAVAGGYWWYINRRGCRDLNPSEQKWLDDKCKQCSQRAKDIHLGSFWDKFCSQGKIVCPVGIGGIDDPYTNACSQYGFGGYGQIVALPPNFSNIWQEVCKTIIHEAIHLQCGLRSTTGDLDQEGTGGVYLWADFLDTLPNCPASSQKLFTSWIKGEPKKTVCDAVRNHKKPGDVFILDKNGCPTSVK